jgi:hypothetical protein
METEDIINLSYNYPSDDNSDTESDNGIDVVYTEDNMGVTEMNDDILSTNMIPDIVFIIPYREREAHLNCYMRNMTFLLKEFDDNVKYEFVISEQGDKREFNRGAMKNLGFLYIKNKYPNDYKDMTFVFNDVDTMPGVKGIIPNYIINDDDAVKVRHFFGFKIALGGIFSIKGDVFESINGFPNYWGWGFEDNCLQKRLERKKFVIDRSNFSDINSRDWVLLYHGSHRNLDNNVVNKFIDDNGNNGLNTLTYNRDNFTKTEIDSIFKKITFNSWDIPEKVNDVFFEKKNNPRRVIQPKVNMMNIMNFR